MGDNVQHAVFLTIHIMIIIIKDKSSASPGASFFVAKYNIVICVC